MRATMVELDSLDHLLAEIGTSVWSVIHFIAGSLALAALAPSLMNGEFINPSPSNFQCSTPTNNNESECLIQINETKTLPCQEWIYDNSTSYSTVTTQWDLVCENGYLHPLYQSVFTGGCLLGCILGGFLATRFGRKATIQIGSYIITFASASLSIVPNFSAVLIIRFVIGVSTSMIIYPGIMLGLEVCISELRSIVGIILAVPYGLYMVIISGMAYGIREWRLLQLVSCSLYIPLLIISFLIDESPKWLLVNGHLGELATVMKRAYRFSGKKYDEEQLNIRIREIYKTLSPDNAEVNNSSWFLLTSLFTHPDMRRITIVSFSYWFLQGMVYLGIPLSADEFSSPFLYMGLMGLTEILSNTVTGPITKKYGRRIVCKTSILISGLGIMTTALLKVAYIEKDSLELFLALLSYFFVCVSYQVCYLYTSELFPTTVRPYGTSLVEIGAYLSFSVSPLLDYLTSDFPLVKPVILSSCCAVCVILMYFLPETNNQPLMETLADLTQRLHCDKQEKENHEIYCKTVDTYGSLN